MVDELELLKKDWQKQEETLPHFSKEELNPMLLKKSSSVVQWILIVSVLEFGLWILLTFGVRFNNDQGSNVQNVLSSSSLEVTLTVIHLAALVFFLGWFFRNYRKIKNTDSPSVLMKNIINTRRTVKYYIWFNIIFFIAATIGSFIFIEINAPETIKEGNILIAIGLLVLILALAVGVLALFYRLLYGRLLKRLTANYNELKKLEV